MAEEKDAEPAGKAGAKSSAGVKFLWSSLDRIVFIGVGVLGTIATTYITGMLKLNPPELKATPVYSRIEAGAVARQVGSLKLDYQPEASRPYGVLRVDIANEGRGPAEGVRFQVKLPALLAVAYDEEPDFKVYAPSQLSLEKNEFYAVLDHFPSGARDVLALRIEGDAALLASARVKLVNDEYEGEVAEMEGVGGDQE